MESLKTTLDNKYTVYTVNSNKNKFNTQYTVYTVYSSKEIKNLFSNLADLIPDDGYDGFYVNRLKQLGIDRFMQLANMARAKSDTPARLFCWFLKNEDKVV